MSLFEKHVVMAKAKEAKIEENDGPFGKYQVLKLVTEDGVSVSTILRDPDAVNRLAAFKTINPVPTWVILYEKNLKGYNELLNIVANWVL
jgi:hypothetical protein